MPEKHPKKLGDEMPWSDVPQYEVWVVIHDLGVGFEVKGLKRACALYDALQQHFTMLSPRPESRA